MKRLLWGSLALAMSYPSAASAKTPAEMEPLTWLAVPDTKMRSVQADPKLYADLQGNGFPNIINAWGGGVLDTQRSRMVIWGGGHNDYYGNEVYAFDIVELQWERLTEPTVDWDNCGDNNADGTANARHTYAGMAYIEHADRFFVSGGALNCTSGSCGADTTWEFDFDTATWTDRQASGAHGTQCENNAAYDSTSGIVYWGDSSGLYAYDYDANSWSQLNSDYLYAAATTIDTTRGVLYAIKEGEVTTYDIAGNDFTGQVLATSGGDAYVAGTSMGLAYDPVADRIVGWDGVAVYAMDPTTSVWEVYDVPGAPEPEVARAWGRWRYVPGINAFVLIAGVDTDVYFFKLSEGGMIPDPPDDGDGDGDDDGTDEGGTEASDDGDDTGADGPSVDDDGSEGVDPDGVGDDGAGTTTSSGQTDSGGAGSDDEAGGCSCRTSSSPFGGWLLLPFIAGLRGRRRRAGGVSVG